jgi:hypothetical protein
VSKIVHHEFPIPTIPPPEAIPKPQINDPSFSTQVSATPTPSSQIEKAPPPNLSTPQGPTPQWNASPPGSQTVVPDSAPSSTPALEDALPQQLLSFYIAIKRQLTTSFSKAPPYTIQRFSELILHPTAHYRTLPSYLRALDRVLSVSSTSLEYPLPAADPIASGYGKSYLAVSHPSSSDDFNGAALTRIPWLRDTDIRAASVQANAERVLSGELRTESTSLIDGPNGAGSLETVTVSRDRDPHALAQTATPDGHQHGGEAVQGGRVTRSSTAQARKDEVIEADTEEEPVHARGPEEIGLEDVGPQATGRASGKFDAEAALGRPGEAEGTGNSVMIGGDGETTQEKSGMEVDGQRVDGDASSKDDPQASVDTGAG